MGCETERVLFSSLGLETTRFLEECQRVVFDRTADGGGDIRGWPYQKIRWVNHVEPTSRLPFGANAIVFIIGCLKGYAFLSF